MEITGVRIFLREEERLKAYAAVTFDSVFVVHNIRVIAGRNGLFVSMPSKKRKDGKYKDVAHPITTDFRRLLDRAIVERYKEVAAEKAAASPSAGDVLPENVSASSGPGSPAMEADGPENQASPDIESSAEVLSAEGAQPPPEDQK
ncbi:MAG: septation regulator SpoVG [Elusimicrobiota bacterium]|nr:septation regulator SpoVG [Elusimicrobiota bacterium]